MLQYLEVIPFSNTSNTFPILRGNSLPEVRWQRPVKNYLNHTWSHWSLASIHSHRPFQLYAVTSARGRLYSLPTLSLSLRRSFECRIEYLVLLFLSCAAYTRHQSQVALCKNESFIHGREPIGHNNQERLPEQKDTCTFIPCSWVKINITQVFFTGDCLYWSDDWFVIWLSCTVLSTFLGMYCLFNHRDTVFDLSSLSLHFSEHWTYSFDSWGLYIKYLRHRVLLWQGMGLLFWQCWDRHLRSTWLLLALIWL